MVICRQEYMCRSRSRAARPTAAFHHDDLQGDSPPARQRKCGGGGKKKRRGGKKKKKHERSRTRQPYIGTKLSIPYLSSKFTR